jgi:quinol monooxygenase YgiN
MINSRFLFLALVLTVSFAQAKEVPPEMGPFGEITRLQLKSDRDVQPFIEAVATIIKSSRSEPGNITWTVQQSISDPTKFVFYTKWKDKNAFNLHLTLIGDYLKQSNLLIDGPADLTFYTPIDSLPGEKYRDFLLGGWQLTKFLVMEDDQAVPFCGENGKLSGLLIYERAGTMSAAVNCPVRGIGNIPADDYHGKLFYAGNFTVNDGEITHDIVNSSEDSLIGTKGLRHIEKVESNDLVLKWSLGPHKSFRTEWVRK